MNKAINLPKYLLIFGIPLLLIGMMVLIAKSTVFNENSSSLSLGITFDLLLTLPLVYFLLIRKTNIPKTTVVPVLIVGIIICSFILPSENQYYLSLFKTWVFPVVELTVIAFVIYHVRKGIKQYKLNKTGSLDFFTTLKTTCQELLPKGAVFPVVTEVAVFYYGFVNWKKRKLNENEFSYHKESGTVTLLIAIIFIVGIETITFHILLSKWNMAAAWIMTFLSIYSGIQLLGFAKSMSKRPISIENNKLFLRYGIMSETIIDLANIDSIEVSSKEIEFNKETRKLSILGDLESHNVVISLKEEGTLTRLYGIKRSYKNLALHLDSKTEFKNRIHSALQ